MITGGLGFIGLQVAKLLVEQGRKVLLLDNLSPQIHGAVPDLSSQALLRHPLVEIVRADAREPGLWAKVCMDVSVVVHLAAETGTGQSMYEIQRYADVNVGGTASLLDFLANHAHGVRRLILASSRAVYGEGAYQCRHCGLVYPPMRAEAALRAGQWEPLCPQCGGGICATATPEDAPPAPASIYAATKLAQEDLVRIAGRALGIGTVIFRFQNVYGEGQSLKNPYTGILSIFSNQLRQGKAVNLYEDGRESRDFIHVSDIACAVSLAVESDRADGYTLNVGSGRATSVATVASLLKERFRSAGETFVSGQCRLGDIRHGFADLTLFRERLNAPPGIPLEEGLNRFVSWVQTQPVERDRLSEATDEMTARGLMHSHAPIKATTL